MMAKSSIFIMYIILLAFSTIMFFQMHPAPLKQQVDPIRPLNQVHPIIRHPQQGPAPPTDQKQIKNSDEEANCATFFLKECSCVQTVCRDKSYSSSEKKHESLYVISDRLFPF